MKNPYPINLTTPEEVRAQGWFAEARDSDGHLISCIAGPGLCSDEVLGEFLREYAGEGGCTVTAWPQKLEPVR